MNKIPSPKIIYFRQSFATNSSSSHSVLLFKDDISSLINDNVSQVSSDDGTFGWEDFILKSKEEKIKYLHSQIAESWRYDQKLPEYYKNRYVDHQSVWGMIPVPNEQGNDVHPKWLQKMEDWVSNEKIVIYGGNDNSSSPTQFLPPPNLKAKEAKHLNVKTNTENFYSVIGTPGDRNVVGTYHEDADCFVIFNKSNGAKIKLKFKDFNDESIESKFSPYPELVDLKITDYCPFNCDYCYQDSTLKGKHADFEAIKKTIDILAELNVFELAIGGGEPTLHPNFIEILEYSKEKGIVPNFTTKNYSLLKNSKLVKAISDHCGGFAFSVDSIKDINQILDEINRTQEAYDSIKNKIVIQHPVGTCSKEELRKIFYAAPKISYKITFLGHKETGRGNKSLVKANNRDVLQMVAFSKLNRGNDVETPHVINIDTSFAKDMEAEIKNLLGEHVFEQTMSTKDGVTSVYIDAVKEEITASSYEPERETFLMKALYGNKEEFKKVWKQIQRS